MPVDFNRVKGVENMEAMPEMAFDIKHQLMTETTRLKFLGDIIPIRIYDPLIKIISLGDIFISLGIIVFFQETMIEKT